MSAPKVLLKRNWGECEEYDPINAVLEAGQTYDEGVCGYCCCSGGLQFNVIDISWDANYGSFGRMAVTVNVVDTDPCGEDIQCSTLCDMVDNYFYLSPDGEQTGTKCLTEVTGATGQQVHYIVAAESDLPEAFARPKVGGSLASGRKGLV